MSSNPYESPSTIGSSRRLASTNDLHSELVLNRAPRAAFQSAVATALKESKFRIDHDEDRMIDAVYPGWRGFAITDRQAASFLSIAIKEADGVTAVSSGPPSTGGIERLMTGGLVGVVGKGDGV